MSRQLIDPSSSAFFDNLEQQIAEATVVTNFQNDAFLFLAPSAIERLADAETIAEALKAESCFANINEILRVELAFLILRDCKKLFLICIAQGMSLSFFARTRHLLKKDDTLTRFIDSDLPLTNTDEMDPKFHASFMNKFYSYQYRLLAPRFDAGVFDMQISNHTVVPMKQGKWMTEGAEGEIYDVRVHHELGPLPASTKNVLWSLKHVLKVTKDGASEIAFLKKLQAVGFNHEHLLMPRFGFFHRGKGFLVSDKASQDLGYLFETSEPSDIGATSSWLLAQMRGLVDALSHIHDLKPGVSIGCLHDIKPDNIVVFLAEDEQPTLKFIDFGFAKFNSDAASGGSSDKARGGGDFAYAPPERFFGEVSQPYDIWSIGCVFVEMLVWFTEGKQGYLEFTDVRIQEFDTEVQFHLNGRMTKTVSEKLDDLYEGEWKVAIKVIDAMLGGNPENRITAAEVVAGLEDSNE